MSYYFSKLVSAPFDEVVEKVRAELGKEGFGVLTEIDVQATMKKKLGAQMPAYLILGACNPGFAFEALQAENKIGTMLPCNVVVRADESDRVEVAAVDPVASMSAVENPSLGEVAGQVREKLRRVVDAV